MKIAKENMPVTQKRIVYSIPGMDRANVQRDLVYKSTDGGDLKLDVYVSPDAVESVRLPGVVFIHGGPVSPQMQAKDWGAYQSWGELVAASGFVGVTHNHRYYGYAHLEQAGEDVIAAIDYVRQHADMFHLDPDRLGLFVFSGGGPLITFALREKPSYVRCIAIYYARLDLRSGKLAAKTLSQEVLERFSPAVYASAQIPLLIARAGLEKSPQLNETIDGFAQAALQANVPLDLFNHAQGQHGFDILDDDGRSREIIAHTLDFFKANLR